MSIDVYEQIPVMENEKFLLREIEDGDAEHLLKVYSDKNAVPLFNSDNCVNGFYYTTNGRNEGYHCVLEERISKQILCTVGYY